MGPDPLALDENVILLSLILNTAVIGFIYAFAESRSGMKKTDFPRLGIGNALTS
jgi:hypothetical protein